MRVEYEYKEKVYEYFSREILGYEPKKVQYAMSNMSIFSISANYIWIANEKEVFYNYVADIFQKLIF